MWPAGGKQKGAETNVVMWTWLIVLVVVAVEAVAVAVE